MLNRAAWTLVCRKVLSATVHRMAWKVEGLEVEYVLCVRRQSLNSKSEGQISQDLSGADSESSNGKAGTDART